MATPSTTSVAAETKPIYFWRETEKVYDFLSQWYTYPFTAPPPSNSNSTGPMAFLTTEQYMMYQKAIFFQDLDIAAKIMKEGKPSKQKSLGRKVANFDGKAWDKVKEQVVEDGNWWKFTQGKVDAKEMSEMLLKTGDRLLVEASPYDRIWGIGYDATNADGNQSSWGQNLLGKALMRVRGRIRAEGTPSDAVIGVDDAEKKL